MDHGHTPVLVPTYKMNNINNRLSGPPKINILNYNHFWNH